MIKAMIEKYRTYNKSKKEPAMQALRIRTNLYAACHGDFANLPDYYSMPAADVRNIAEARFEFAAVPAWAR